jgi:putative hydrolase of the HAD superfamily
MSFEAVIFDFYGTLTPMTAEPVWKDLTARTAGPLGIDPEQWRRALDDSYAERSTGALGDMPATFRELARRLGAEPDDDAIAAACAARRAGQREMLVFRPDALDVVAALRARQLRVGVLSDCTIELAECFDELPVAQYVNARVLSCEQGTKKPDPALFYLVASMIGARADQCLYIGDGGSRELTGASNCGMTAVMLRGDDWYTVQARGREDDWAGPEVPSLTAVLALFGS